MKQKNTCNLPFGMVRYVLRLHGALLYRYALPYSPQKEVNPMKEGIHPKYQHTTITCACGNVIETGSTKKDIKVEVCSKCHPFYTGKQKMVDTGGRVSRFKKKFGLE